LGEEDTICAIVTPPGEGGIGIVRMSGPEALAIAGKIFRSPRGKSVGQMATYTAHYGHIVEPESGRVIDEVILLIMLAPGSYTREDVVEVHCHGGIVPLQRVFELIIAQGARIAQPGEFTKRAFLHGRLDLSQAEAVIDIVRAKTAAGLQAAMGQLGGGLSRRINPLRDRLLGLLAQVEVSIDFPEYDVPEATVAQIQAGCGDIKEEIEQLLQTAEQGRILRDGLRTIILGKPNVGKSSLLNALLREKRALVTAIPGTTRDVIEEYINIRGIPLKIMDTAGIRPTEDLLERLGIEQTRRFLAAADLALVLLDAQAGWTQEDGAIMAMLGDKKAIILVNKIDIGSAIESQELKRRFPTIPTLQISVKEGWGLEELEEVIAKMVFTGEVRSGESVLVSNARHREALMGARDSLKGVLETLDAGMPVDLAAIDLREAWEHLSAITGDVVGEDIIQRIFSDFCVGK